MMDAPDKAAVEYTALPNELLLDPCPASIWLLGAAASCRWRRGHDGMHEVRIQWSVA